WSSDVCSSDLPDAAPVAARHLDAAVLAEDSRAVPAGVVDDPELAPGLGGPDRGVRATDGAVDVVAVVHEDDVVPPHDLPVRIDDLIQAANVNPGLRQ